MNKEHKNDNETIVAQATPVGIGGIGIIRISGSKVLPIMEGVLGRKLPPRETYVGNFYDQEHQILDRGIALFFPAPHSFTGEDVLELQGHGGQVVLNVLLENLLKWEGVRLAEPGEYSQRAFLNGKIDLTQAEAIADLIEGESLQAVQGAMRSLQGEFSLIVRELAEHFVYVRSKIEAQIDFAEEEEVKEDKGDLLRLLKRLLSEIDQVLEVARQGVLNQAGFRVVISGQPNVGKSSLFNWLCGEEYAIVTDQPGTTRDLIKGTLQLKGKIIQITDTAGLREAKDIVEQEGIRRAQEAAEQADLILLVKDIHSAKEAREIAKTIVVYNKIDLIGETPKIVEEKGQIEVYLSAKERKGMELLRQAIGDFFKTTPGVCSARPRHVQALVKAREIVAKLLNESLTLDVVANEIYAAHKQLMEITGEVVTEELLDQIFSKFCIGK